MSSHRFILIAESGSTKTAWRLLQGDQAIADFQSAGINPEVQSPDTIRATLRVAFEQQLENKQPTQVYFYGAGMRGEKQKEIIRSLLGGLLPAAKVHAEHDILAAVRSTGRQAGIVGILGTGSNSALYEDGQIRQNLGGHGYLFGDEGSGMDLGKHLLKGLLQGDFSEKVVHLLDEAGLPAPEALKTQIYTSEKANVKLAGLAQSIGKAIHLPEIHSLVRRRFMAFLDTTVCRYPAYRTMPLDVIGSIGYVFRRQLEEACAEREVALGELIRYPLNHLVDFHMRHLE